MSVAEKSAVGIAPQPHFYPVRYVYTHPLTGTPVAATGGAVGRDELEAMQNFLLANPQADTCCVTSLLDPDNMF